MAKQSELSDAYWNRIVMESMHKIKISRQMPKNADVLDVLHDVFIQKLVIALHLKIDTKQQFELS